MKKRGFLNLFMVAALAISAGSLYSCKDYDDEMRAELEGQIIDGIKENARLDSVVSAQVGRIDVLIGQLQKAQEACEKEREQIQKKFDNYLEKTAFDKAMEDYVTKEEFNKKVEEYTGIIAKFDADIKGLYTRVNVLEKAKIEAEERLAALEKDVAGNKTTIAAHTTQITELYTLIADLQTLQKETTATISVIQNDLSALSGKVTELGQNLSEFQTKVNGDLTGLQEDLTETQSNITKVETDLKAQIEALKQSMKDDIVTPEIDKAIGEVNIEVGRVAAESAHNKEQVERLNSIYQDILTNSDVVSKDFTKRIDSLSTVTSALAEQLSKTDSTVQANAAVAKAYTDSVVNEVAAQAAAEITTMKADLAALGLKAGENGKAIEDLQSKNKEFTDALAAQGLKIDDMGNMIADLNKVSTDLKDSLAAQGIHINEMGELIAGLDAKVSALDGRLNDVLAKADKAFDTANEALQNVNALQTTLGEVKKELQDQIDANKDQIQAINDKLLKEFEPLKAQVAKNTEEIAGLNSMFNNVMNQMITSVALNGAYSPVIGYFSLPTGLKSNVVAAFYGQALDDVNFPTALTNDYIYTEQAFTAREMQLLGISDEKLAFVGGQPILEEGNNAGKLYVTVNPNTVNMDNKTWGLYNSIGEESPVKLGKAVRSNDKLTFGYTRAAVQNGFYEIPANLTADGIQNARLRVEFEELKAAIKDVLSYEDGVDLTNLISTLYKAVNDIADANAVAATWSDSLGEHSVLSDYGIAAVAVKPLGYNFMKDKTNVTEFPGIDKANALLDKIANKLYGMIPEFPQLKFENLPKIDSIKVEQLSDSMLAKFVVSLDTTVYVDIDTVLKINQKVPVKDVIVPVDSIAIDSQVIKVPVQITIPGDTLNHTLEGGEEIEMIVPSHKVDTTLEVKIDGETIKYGGDTIHMDSVEVKLDQQFKISKGIHFTMTRDLRDAVKDLWGNVDGMVGDVNEMLMSVKKFVEEDLQSMLDEINGNINKVETDLNQAITDMKNKFGQLIQKVNDKLCKLVNSVHSKVQPVMFMKTSGDFVMLSGAKNYPSEAPTDFVLSLTSYTAELLTPAAKKFVAVTDVIKGGQSAKGGNQSLVNDLKTANNNADLNKVLPGKTLGVKVQGLKPGNTYEFTYSALDFHGQIVNTKYYIAVK